MGVVVYVAKVIFRLNVLELNGVGRGLLQGFAGLQGQDLGRVVVTEVVQADWGDLNRVSEDQGGVIQRTVEADLNLCGPITEVALSLPSCRTQLTLVVHFASVCEVVTGTARSQIL